MVPAGLPQGLQHPHGRPLRLVRSRSRATRLWSGPPSTTSNATGVNGDQADNRGAKPERSTSSCAAARPGPSRPTSRPPTPARTTTSALRWRCRATPCVVGALSEDSSATGIERQPGRQLRYRRRGRLRLRAQRHDLVPAGLRQGLQHRVRRPSSAGSVALSGDTAGRRGRPRDSSATGVDGNQADNSA